MADDGKQLKETSKSKKSWFKQLFTKKIRDTPNSSKLTDASIKASVLPELPEEPPIPPQQPSETANYPLYIGKYDYLSRTNDGLSFKKGDLVYIINTDDRDWWFVKSKDTGQEGYIPSNYVAEYKSLDAEE